MAHDFHANKSTNLMFDLHLDLKHIYVNMLRNSTNDAYEFFLQNFGCSVNTHDHVWIRPCQGNSIFTSAANYVLSRACMQTLRRARQQFLGLFYLCGPFIVNIMDRPNLAWPYRFGPKNSLYFFFICAHCLTKLMKLKVSRTDKNTRSTERR